MKYILAIIIIFAMYWAWHHGFSTGIGAVPSGPSESGVRNVDENYYIKIFDYAMTTVEPGKSYNWSSYSIKGTVYPGDYFTSKSGYDCRKFKESFTLPNQEKTSEGIACKRKGHDGWCRLRGDEAETCALEKPADIFGGIALGTGDVMENAKGVMGKLEGLLH